MHSTIQLKHNLRPVPSEALDVRAGSAEPLGEWSSTVNSKWCQESGGGDRFLRVVGVFRSVGP